VPLTKREIEKKITQIFLDLYNLRTGRRFQIQKMSDTPDATCVDVLTNEILELEITRFEDLEGQISYLKGVQQPPVSPTTGSSTYTRPDVVNHFVDKLSEKLQSSYGTHTALVFYQVSPLWNSEEWAAITELIKSSVIRGKEGCFGAGIWMICSDNTVYPSRNDLVCLIEPIIDGQ
jgi:hypothetical protein